MTAPLLALGTARVAPSPTATPNHGLRSQSRTAILSTRALRITNKARRAPPSTAKDHLVNAPVTRLALFAALLKALLNVGHHAFVAVLTNPTKKLRLARPAFTR